MPTEELELGPEAEGSMPRKQAEKTRPPGHNMITKLRDGLMLLADDLDAQVGDLEQPEAKELLSGMIAHIREKCEECEAGRGKIYPETDEREDVKDDELKKHIKHNQRMLKTCRKALDRRDARLGIRRNQGR